jgi:transposase
MDVSFSEVQRQLAYKAMWAGKELVVANRFFPSSKLCSGCGHKKETLKLSERTYTCENCGLIIDRDLNAAINLANYSPTQKDCGCEAFGESSSIEATQFSGSMKNEGVLTIKNLQP